LAAIVNAPQLGFVLVLLLPTALSYADVLPLPALPVQNV
jgi:hypothetical protein